MKKYFVSYIIPAYNCRETLSITLASIVMQQFKHEIQVVIADDCSTEDYTDIIDKYKNDINITLVRLEKNSGPGVARQIGINNSNAKYISFIDADDQLTFDAYANVREVLLQQEPELLITNFYEQDRDLKTYIMHNRDTIWMHGKYFKKDFLNKNNIKFHESLRTHEDIYFNHLVFNIATKIFSMNFVTYIWIFKEDSLTRRVYNRYHTYIEECFLDYIESTVKPCEILIENDFNKYKEKVKEIIINHIVYLYFYIQSFKYNLPNEWYKHNLFGVKKVINFIEKNYDMDYKEIYYFIAKKENYGIIRSSCEHGVGNFIEQDTFYNFLEECSKLELN